MLKLRKFLESLHFCPGHQLSMESQEAEWVGRAPEKGVRMLKQEGNYKTREMFHPSTQPHTPLGWEKADASLPPQPDFSLVFLVYAYRAHKEWTESMKSEMFAWTEKKLEVNLLKAYPTHFPSTEITEV